MVMQSKNSPPKLPPDIEKLLEEDPELKELFLKNWGVKNFGNKDDLFNSGPSFTGSSSPASEAYRSGPSYTGSSSPIGGGYHLDSDIHLVAEVVLLPLQCMGHQWKKV